MPILWDEREEPVEEHGEVLGEGLVTEVEGAAEGFVNELLGVPEVTVEGPRLTVFVPLLFAEVCVLQEPRQ